MKKIFFLLFVIIVVGGGFGGYVYAKIFIKDLRSTRAETMSSKYVANLYTEYQIVGRNCQGEDTNGDSYVSCDIRIQKGSDNTTEKVLNLQCPTMWKSYTGNTCKESRLAIPGQE
jgi:flagellar basal body-associated protein FliL